MEFIGELLILFFGEILAELFIKCLAPVLKHIGAVFKFLFLFWRYRYSEIHKRESNIAFGVIISLTITIIIIWNLYN